MHELTASEAATVLTVLSRDGNNGASGPMPSGIPSSTFYATRRKIYEAGWLTDRYVPHPWATGISGIDLVLARPSPVEGARQARDWASSPENVLLWSGPNSLFGVFFRRSRPSPAPEDAFVVSVSARKGSIPVYFDFSRPWSRFIGVESETGYPRSIGLPEAAAERSGAGAVRDLIRQDPVDPVASPGARRWHSPSGLSRVQLRVLEKGTARSRTFLNLDGLPPFEGRQLAEIVFLTGELREGVSSRDVLGALSSECRVSPLLLADDGSRLIVIALGQVGAGAPVRTTVPRATGRVADTLHASVKGLRMVIERTDSVLKLTDHRYDRILPGARSDRSAEDVPGSSSGAASPS